MKNLIFDELLLLSNQQKRARKIQFHRSATIISGDNHTGKSQVLKSLYACLGADAAVASDLKEATALRSVLRFTIDSRRYSILHDRDTYTLFGEANKVLGLYSAIQGDLAVELAKLLDFHLEFYVGESESSAAHPRYLFAPFYIDQDSGWRSSWSSFANQHTSRRSDTLEYHVGIRPNSYYRAKAILRQVQSERREPNAQRATLAKLLATIEPVDTGVEFKSDMESYSKEIERLLLVCRELQQREEAFRERVVLLENERIQLHLEMEIASRSVREFQKDFSHAAKLREGSISCPTCGAVYQNGIAERFDIVRDEIICEDLYTALGERVAAIDAQLASEQSLYDTTRSELDAVQAALDVKQQDLTLRDVIVAEGRKDFRDSIALEVADLEKQLADLSNREADAKRIMKDASDRTLREQILDYYRARLQSAAVRLQASPLPPEMLGGISPQIPRGSSEFPRRLLSYFVAILHTIHRNQESTYCPVVVDAVNQQDQSSENLARMYQELATGLPTGTQLILGCVDTNGVKFPGEVVTLDEKHGLLRPQDFEENFDAVRSLLNARFEYQKALGGSNEEPD